MSRMCRESGLKGNANRQGLGEILETSSKINPLTDARTCRFRRSISYSEISTIEIHSRFALEGKYKHAILRIWCFYERCYLTQFFNYPKGDNMVHVSHSAHAAPVFYILLIMFILFVSLIALAIKALIFCKIFSKAGYSWALGLLILVPIANIIIAFYLAFADWPVQRQVRQLRQQNQKPQA